MSKEFKYIITERGLPILFGKANTHSEFVDFKPVSAGFCTIKYNTESCKFEAECFGESVSLKLKADPQDKQDIELLFNYY